MFEKIQEIIADKLSIDVEEITLDSSFIDDLNADSLDIVELIMALEDELEMEIPDEDVENFKTVGDVVNYVKTHHKQLLLIAHMQNSLRNLNIMKD